MDWEREHSDFSSQMSDLSSRKSNADRVWASSSAFFHPTNRLHLIDDHPDVQLPVYSVFFIPALGYASAGAMARMGGRRLRYGAAREQAYPAGHWRGLVSLVPRDGSRIL